MPTVYNPSKFELFCQPIGRVLAANEHAEITVAQARSLAGNAVFRVVADEPTARPIQPTQTKEPRVVKPPAQRQKVQRGAEVVETDSAPERETR